MEDIEKFLEETSDFWNTVSYNQALADAGRMSPDEWHRTWGPGLMADKDLAADYYALKKTKPLPERLRSSFAEFEFNPDPVWRQQIYQSEFEDVPREEFDQTLDNMRKYYLEEQQAREDKANYKKREKEVKDWPLWRDVLASDYEKQRYVEEPQNAIFGKQAPGFFGSSLGAKADLAAGAAAAAADIGTPFIPVPGINIISNVLAGPSIRAARDVAHKASGSRYQKDLKQIGMDAISDAGLNAATLALANARRGARVISNLTTPEVKNAFEYSLDKENVKIGLDMLKKAPAPDYDAAGYKAIVDMMPESSLKSDLLAQFADVANTGVDPIKLSNIVTRYRYDLGNEVMARVLGPNNYKTQDIFWKHVNEPPTRLASQAMTTVPVKDMTAGNRIQYRLLSGANAINLGRPGTVAFETMYNATGRGAKPETREDVEAFERQKEYYKKTRGEDWLKYPSLAPKQQEGDPAWEAYKEVTGIK